MSTESSDEEWNAKDDEELVPGFESHTVMSSVDMPSEDESTIVEFFLARNSTTNEVCLIKVDHDNEESTLLNGEDCDAFRRELCSMKGIDADADKETANVVMSNEVGKLPKALEEFDKKNEEREKQKIEKAKVQKKSTKKEEPKVDAAKGDREEKQTEKPTESKKGPAKKMTKKGQQKKQPPKKKEAPKQPKKGSSVVEAKKDAESGDTSSVVEEVIASGSLVSNPSTAKIDASQAQEAQKKKPATQDAPKKKPAKRKREEPETILDYVVKQEPAQKKTCQEPFEWQLTLNGKSFASLKAALSSLSD